MECHFGNGACAEDGLLSEEFLVLVDDVPDSVLCRGAFTIQKPQHKRLFHDDDSDRVAPLTLCTLHSKSGREARRHRFLQEVTPRTIGNNSSSGDLPPKVQTIGNPDVVSLKLKPLRW